MGFKIDGLKNHKLLLSLLLISFSFNCLSLLFFARKYYNTSRLKNTRSVGGVVIIGDSRVSGGNWGKVLDRKDVVNCGISGYTAEQLIKKLDTAYTYKPVSCIIQIGINDLRNNASADTTFFYYTQIIDSLLGHHIKPIVTSIIPLRADYWSDLVDYKVVNARTDSLNNQLLLLCKKRNVGYVDINQVLTEENNRLKREYTYDGIHLNDSGYILAGRQIIPYLQ